MPARKAGNAARMQDEFATLSSHGREERNQDEKRTMEGTGKWKTPGAQARMHGARRGVDELCRLAQPTALGRARHGLAQGSRDADTSFYTSFVEDQPLAVIGCLQKLLEKFVAFLQ